VHAAHFTPDHKLAGRYKLFNNSLLRDTVLERLRLECIERWLCPANVTVRLGLMLENFLALTDCSLTPWFRNRTRKRT